MAHILDKEVGTFERHRQELVGTAEGKFALIHEDVVVGIYESKGDAIAQGYRQFGNVPFLVKQIVKIDLPQDFVSNLLGV